LAFTRVAASTLALSPIRDTLIEGFSHFVTSMTAPIVSGWGGCRMGFASPGKRRLCTAHTRSGHWRGLDKQAVINHLASRQTNPNMGRKNAASPIGCLAIPQSHSPQSRRHQPSPPILVTAKRLRNNGAPAAT